MKNFLFLPKKPIVYLKKNFLMLTQKPSSLSKYFSQSKRKFLYLPKNNQFFKQK